MNKYSLKIYNFIEKINKKFNFDFSNLINIAQNHQGILSRGELVNLDYEFTATDSTEVSYFRNFVHCSLSAPNIYMLRSKIGASSRMALLEIAVDELFSNPFIVFPTNSARFGYESLYANNWNKTIAIDGLNRAYSRDEFRLKYNLRDEVTTCPQAELLFLNKINWSIP